MKTLLWLEELQMEEDIKQYDLVGVFMGMQRNLLILDVRVLLLLLHDSNISDLY